MCAVRGHSLALSAAALLLLCAYSQDQPFKGPLDTVLVTAEVPTDCRDANGRLRDDSTAMVDAISPLTRQEA